MTSLVLTITETMRYRGAIGQWSWVLHRLSGLGVVLFITLHVIDTSWAVFYPQLYVEAIATYQTPLFTIGEFGLVACVIYHALNGLRIVVFDFKPVWWKYQQKAAGWVLIGTLVILVPVFIGMFGHVLKFYSNPESKILGIGEVLSAQLPFAAGIGAAIIGAILFSGVVGIIRPERSPAERKAGVKAKGSKLERFWWSFMRLSGLIILPLVFGHLAMMHVIQGVFDITAANFVTVGTTAVNNTGTAVEFVANRWNYLIGPLAIWRLYDLALLALVTVHGFNGLRLVLTDYTGFSPLLKRGAIYLCVIGAVVLLVLGAGALFGTINDSAIKMAQEAMATLHQ